MPGTKPIKSESWAWFKDELARRLGDDGVRGAGGVGKGTEGAVITEHRAADALRTAIARLEEAEALLWEVVYDYDQEDVETLQRAQRQLKAKLSRLERELLLAWRAGSDPP